MKTTTKNTPFGNTSLINWFFDDVLTRDSFNTKEISHSVYSALNRPGMNVLESDKDHTLQIAAPGLDKKDFKIDIKNSIIHISAGNKETEAESKKYKSREFNFSSFKRSYRIPEHTDLEKISASYENGILSVTLPKTEIGKNGLNITIK